MKKLALLLCLSLTLLSSRNAQALQAQPVNVRAFMLTTTYGIVAGALLGAASLALSESPGDNLRNIAMGASIGLYLGIGIGVYQVYFSGDDEPAPDAKPGAKPGAAPQNKPVEVDPENPIDLGQQPQWQIVPTVMLSKTHAAPALRVSFFW